MAKGRVKEKKILEFSNMGGWVVSWGHFPILKKKIFKVRMVRTTQDGNGMARTV